MTGFGRFLRPFDPEPSAADLKSLHHRSKLVQGLKIDKRH
jgi:hypothetical protein